MSGVIGEKQRARMNAAVSKMVLEANRRDLDEVTRARHLEHVGAIGHVAFGFYVDGFGDREAGSLCNAAVIPSGVVFLDADASAEPGAELGRAARSGLTFAVESWTGTVANAEFDAPWQMKSLDTPGRLKVVARVVATWPAGSASFAFATNDGADEAVGFLKRHLADTPEM
ncbi:MAG: hypothetical protein ABJB55_09505 [Actinomycetota bacterium]